LQILKTKDTKYTGPFIHSSIFTFALRLHYTNLRNENVGHSAMNTKTLSRDSFQNLIANPLCRFRSGPLHLTLYQELVPVTTPSTILAMNKTLLHIL